MVDGRVKRRMNLPKRIAIICVSANVLHEFDRQNDFARNGHFGKAYDFSAALDPKPVVPGRHCERPLIPETAVHMCPSIWAAGADIVDLFSVKLGSEKGLQARSLAFVGFVFRTALTMVAVRLRLRERKPIAA